MAFLTSDFQMSVFLEGVHPLFGGILRRKGRRLRRRGLPQEPFFIYYRKRFFELGSYGVGVVKIIWTTYFLLRKAERHGNENYTDAALAQEEIPRAITAHRLVNA